MTTTYNLAPIPVWSFTDNEGNPAANGWLVTRRADDPNEVKLIYQDPGGTIPYAAPTPLDDFGRLGPIYWADDENYWVQIQDENGQVIKTIPDFNAVSSGGSGPVTQQIDTNNHILNPQFYFPYEIPSPLTTGPIDICEGGLFFQKSNTNATDTITITPFTLGQNDVPSQPLNYITYESTGVGAGGETYKDFIWPLGRVIGFENTDTSVGMYVISSTSSTVQLIFRQYFGTGGTPSATVNTTLLNYNATTDWSQAATSTAIPSVTGKTLGDNGDDQAYLILRMPLNQVSEVSFANPQLVHYVALPEFEYQNTSFVTSTTIPNPNPDGSDAYKALTLDHTGLHKAWAVPGFISEFKWVADPNVVEDTGQYVGWLKLESTVRNVSRTTYANLFAVIGTSYGVGDGSTTFGLPALGGRVAIPACDASSGISERTAGELIGEETHTLTEAEGPAHSHGQNVSTSNGTGSVLPAYSSTNVGSHGTITTGTLTNSSSRLMTDASGSSTPFNIMQPTAVVGAVLIKY